MSNYFQRVHQITMALAERGDIHAKIRTGVELIAQTIGADYAAYLRFKNQQLHFHSGLTPEVSPTLLKIAHTLLETAEIVYVDEQRQILATRLTGGERILGVLIFHTPQHFTHEQIQLVEILSMQLAAAIHNTRLQFAERNYRKFVLAFTTELRSPLTPLKGFANLLLMGGAGAVTEMQAVFLRNIRDSADRMMMLVNGVLNISRLDAGEAVQMVYESVNLREMITHTVQQVQNRPQHSRKNHNIITHFMEDIPPIQADLEKLTLVFGNVLDNAMHYTRPGGWIEVYVALTQSQKHVLITIADNGVGIPQEMQHNVWKRFARVEEDAVALNVVGTGLGLTIVREFVRLHQGKVWFESERGKGTTFYIQLPIK